MFYGSEGETLQTTPEPLLAPLRELLFLSLITAFLSLSCFLPVLHFGSTSVLPQSLYSSGMQNNIPWRKVVLGKQLGQ